LRYYHAAVSSGRLTQALAMLTVFFFLFVAASTAALCLWAYGAREDIEKQDPSYAAALYRSGAELFWSRGLSLKGHVLLFTRPSSVTRSTLLPLQVMYCVNLFFVALFVGSIVLSIAGHG
jgi:hypothetical protein